MLLEEDHITFSGWSTSVSVGGERGENIIREADAGLDITVQRPLRDLLHRVPRFGVRLLTTLHVQVGLNSLPCSCMGHLS